MVQISPIRSYKVDDDFCCYGFECRIRILNVNWCRSVTPRTKVLLTYGAFENSKEVLKYLIQGEYVGTYLDHVLPNVMNYSILCSGGEVS